MTKQTSDDAVKAAEYNIDTAFDVLRTALVNPEGLQHIPNGAHIVPTPADETDPEVSAANRTLIDTLSSQGQQVITLQVIVAQVTITPDGGLFIGQTYFTPDEAKELGRMIQVGDRPMPGTVGIEFTPDGNVVALRPFFNGREAEAIHSLALKDHPEIPRTNGNHHSHAPMDTFKKLNEVVRPLPARGH